MTDLKKIQEATAPKFPKLKHLRNEQITNKIYTILLMAGITANMDAANKKYLCKYIGDNFEWATAEELELAFQFWCKGILDTKIEHYNTFSVAFIEGVMQSYKRYRGQLRAEQHQPYTEDYGLEPSEDEKTQLQIKDFQIAYDRYLNKKEFWDFGSVKFNFLKAKGVMEFGEEDLKVLQQQVEQLWVHEQKKKGQSEGLTFHMVAFNKHKEQAIKNFKELIMISWWFNSINLNNLELTETLLNL